MFCMWLGLGLNAFATGINPWLAASGAVSPGRLCITYGQRRRS